MNLSLRVLRAVIGFVAGYLVLNSIVYMVSTHPSRFGATDFQLLYLVPIVAILFLLFYKLGNLIHRIHLKKYGQKHPSLKTLWHL